MSVVHDSRYRPDIDALRAFAVLPVVIFHLGASWLPGGFLGVDVFFVISGYLITGLLLRELESGGIDLWAFWQRRIRRILPALIAMVLIAFVAGHLLLYGPDRYMLAVNAAGALLSVGNITHWLNYGGYWSPDATDSPLLHTWSLGVEEQYYFIYPATLLILGRLFKRRIIILLAFATIVGVGAYILVYRHSPGAAFYLFPTRAWELLAGAVAAAANVKRLPSNVTAQIMPCVGLGIILLAYAFITEQQQVVGSVMAVLGAVMVVGAGTPKSFMALGITSRPFILVGLTSYSIYLWHWPLIVLGKSVEIRDQIEFPSWAYFCISLIFGWLSWRYVETPLRRNPQHKLPLVLLAIAILSAGLIYSVRNMNNAEDVSRFNPAEWNGELFSVTPAAPWPDYVRRKMRGINVAPRPADHNDVYKSGIAHHYSAHSGLDILVLGDSHGLMWAPAIDAAAHDLELNVNYMTADGTPIFFEPSNPSANHDGIFFKKDQWTEFNVARLRIIREEKPKTVIIGASWHPDMIKASAALINEIILSGAKLLLIEDAPDYAIGDRNAPSYMAYLGLKADAQGNAYTTLTDNARRKYERETVQSLAAMCGKRCEIVRLRDLYETPGKALQIMKSKTPLYIDSGHLSVSGAMLAKPALESALAESLKGYQVAR